MKFDKFNDFKEKHPKNINLISIIFSVLKFDKSIEISSEQLLNNPKILFKQEVSKFPNFMLVNLLQLENILSIFIIEAKLNSVKSISVILVQFSNILLAEFG